MRPPGMFDACLGRGRQKSANRHSRCLAQNVVNAHQNTLNRIILPEFDGGFPHHSLQDALRLRNCGQRFACSDKAFIRVESHEHRVVVSLKSSLELIAGNPRLTDTVHHRNASGKDLILREPNPAGRGQNLRRKPRQTGAGANP